MPVIEDGDERTAGRGGRGLGMEEAMADLRRVVAYIGIGISVGSESKSHVAPSPPGQDRSSG